MARRSYFNIEALMNNHGAAGKSIVRNIMSYIFAHTNLDTRPESFKSKFNSRFFIFRYEANLMCVLAQKISYFKCGGIGLRDFLSTSNDG